MKNFIVDHTEGSLFIVADRIDHIDRLPGVIKIYTDTYCLMFEDLDNPGDPITPICDTETTKELQIYGLNQVEFISLYNRVQHFVYNS